MKKIIYFFCFVLAFSLILGLFSSFLGSSDKSTEIKNENESSGNSANVNIDFSEKNYVAFGDSITFGADYTRNYAPMDNPYPKLVAEELNLLSYKNLAISGAVFCKNDLNLVCMTDVILSYTDETDIISIMLGVNDWSRSLPLGSIEDNTTSTVYGCLNLIATHLTTTHEHAFSFFMTPYKTTLVRNEDYVLLDVVNAIKQVAFAYNIPVLDMYNLGKYEISPISITIKAGSAEQEYLPGTILTCDEYEIISGELMEGDYIPDNIVITKGEQKVPGRSPNTIDRNKIVILNSEGEDVSSNYVIRTEVGELRLYES